MTETTSANQRPAHLWRPGQSGNPAGRPRGSRNKLAEDFVAALHQDFTIHGMDAIVRARQEDAIGYIRVIAALLPKDVNLNHRNLDDLSDDQLMRKLATLTEMARPLLAKLPVIDVKALEVAEPSSNDEDSGVAPGQTG